MKNEDKIIELLAESLRGQDLIVEQIMGTNQRIDQTNVRLDQTIDRLDHTIERLDRLENRTEKIEGQLITLNMQTVANTRAIFTLAEKVEAIADLHVRVTKLEKTVYQ